MGKIRGLKRKFGNSLRDYKAYLTHYNGYIELYVPQVTYKENTIHGYTIVHQNFLLKIQLKTYRVARTIFMYLMKIML
ncbi:hypothetical protein [Staphylococcus aureus]|uniref:hypothetical protein n=1 Tax=Staphylococcus aureus TaxID=1280 RepID=UPI0009872CCC|nr:hypothetical protein [Staphylococcus aureus]